MSAIICELPGKLFFSQVIVSTLKDHMKFRQLGRTGMEISEIAHGLWGMGSWTDSSDQQSQQALQLAVDLGCNFFDSAWAYGEGKSDGFLGESYHTLTSLDII